MDKRAKFDTFTDSEVSDDLLLDFEIHNLVKINAAIVLLNFELLASSTDPPHHLKWDLTGIACKLSNSCTGR